MNRFNKFWQGRYGIYLLGKTLFRFSFAFLLLFLLLKWEIFYIIAIIGLIYAYFRMFSKNIGNRSIENQKILKIKYKFICKKNRYKGKRTDRRTHRVFRCPNCCQKIRVPKGKGKICIKCPKCRIEFVKKT